jgi:serine protease AprX
MAAFSSRGPTDDGRIKPDVVAPGTNILSTRTSAYRAQDAKDKGPLWGDMAEGDGLRKLYCWSGGTSMSTPLVAGAAAVIRQHLIQQRGHFKEGSKPSGALIKAFLVNGATGIRGNFDGEVPQGRNMVSGFGRVNIRESLTPGPEANGGSRLTHFSDEPGLAVETGQKRDFKVAPEDGAVPLKATLVWTDAPAPAGIGGIVNRLYLQVVKPDGEIVNGDVRQFPSVGNNVQQVVIKPPLDEGTYMVRVRGVSVIRHSPSVTPGQQPRQDFALAISNGNGPDLV